MKPSSNDNYTGIETERSDETVDRSSSTTTTSVRASSRKTRVYLFREFIWQVYGEYLTNERNFQNRLRTLDSKLHDETSMLNDDAQDSILVLDIAGGKGDLSWLLTHVHGVSSVVIDPRGGSNNNNTNQEQTSPRKSAPRPHHIEKSVHYLLQHPEEAKRRTVPGLPTFQPLAALIPQIVEHTRTQKRHRQEQMEICQKDTTVLHEEAANNEALPVLQFQPVRHMRIYMNNDLVDAVRRQLEATELVDEQKETGVSVQGQMVNRIPTQHDRIGKGWKNYWKTALQHQMVNNDGNDLFSDPVTAWNLFRSAKLIVGFHPDQATEACMDLAILLGIPFCVVPCCVFPSEFPDRKVWTSAAGNISSYPYARMSDSKKSNSSGDRQVKGEADEGATTRVRTYSQFMDYLKAKYISNNIQTAKLQFHFTETAKNIVLYTLPPKNGD